MRSFPRQRRNTGEERERSTKVRPGRVRPSNASPRRVTGTAKNLLRLARLVSSLYKHFEDAAVDLVSAGIIHLGYVFRNLDAPREPTLPDVLALYSSPGMDFQDVLKEIQSTVHMPGGKSNRRLRLLLPRCSLAWHERGA